MFSIWPTCDQCGLPYELSEYELNQSLAIPKIVFCSDCHHTFVLEAEEVQCIRETIKQTMNTEKPWDSQDDDEDFPLADLWTPGNPDELEAAHLERMAEQGNTMAMLVLGALYCQGGFGLQRDYEKARYWWQLARDHGESEAVECLQQLEFEITPESRESEQKIPPHWFALREIHTNVECPILFTDAALDYLQKLDSALFGPPGIDGQRPEMDQESLQTQDKIVYEALRLTLPVPCQAVFNEFVKAQFDLEFSLLIQDFPKAAEFGEEKLRHQKRLAATISETTEMVKVEVEQLQRSLDLLNIDVLF